MKRILIAEDEEILSNVLKDRFEAEGWEVVRAVNGEEAIETIKKSPFDLVLLDLLMPKKNGFEVLKEVRSNPELKSLPIIVLSNLGGDDDIKKALTLGANDYYVKTQHPMSEVVEKAKKYESGGSQASVTISVPSQELTDYIKNSRAAGMKDEEIRAGLKKENWADKDIDTALSD